MEQFLAVVVAIIEVMIVAIDKIISAAQLLI